MKIKFLLCTLIGSLLLNCMYAQSTGFGFNIALVNSNITFSGRGPMPQGRSTLQPGFGVFSYAQFSEHFGLTTEVSFVFIGTQVTDTISNQQVAVANGNPLTIKDDIRVGLFRWAILPSYVIQKNFFVMAGPVIDALFFRGYKGDLFGMTTDDRSRIGEYNVNSSGVLNSFKVSAGLGGGYTYNHLRVDLRYIIGLGNLFDKSEHHDESLDRFTAARYNTFQLTIGLVIPHLEDHKRSMKWKVINERKDKYY